MSQAVHVWRERGTKLRLFDHLDAERLKPDCAACDAYCCVGTSLDLPHYRKPPATPCRNLDAATLRCRIFACLEAEGYPFCRGFDCHGAGPAVTALFRRLGRSWPTAPDAAKVQFDVFNLVFARLHEQFHPAYPISHGFPPGRAAELADFVDAALSWLEKDDTV
jgi:hypothetical protein